MTTTNFAVALLVMGVIAAANADARPAARHTQSQAEYPSLETLCSREGTTEQCQCFVPAIKSSLSEHDQHYLRVRMYKYQELKANMHAKMAEAERGTDDSGIANGFGLAMTMAMAGPALQAQIDNPLADDMGADAFESMVNVYVSVKQRCQLGEGFDQDDQQ